MKRLLIALAVLAFSTSLVGVTLADGWSVKSFPQQKFISLATIDSTTITIEWDAASNGTALAETTAVLDLRKYAFAWHANADARPVFGATVSFSGADNAVASAAGDSVTVIPMYSYDGVTWQDAALVYGVGISPLDVWLIDVDDTAGNGLGAGMWRLRISHFDQSASTSRQAWIKPFVYIAKEP